MQMAGQESYIQNVCCIMETNDSTTDLADSNLTISNSVRNSIYKSSRLQKNDLQMSVALGSAQRLYSIRPAIVFASDTAGANVGINVIYSGTVGAAVEGAFLGIPSIAVSLHLGDRTKTQFARGAEIARVAIDRILQHPLDAHRVMNVNVPRTESPDAPMPPIRVAKMNVSAGVDGYERRVSPDGRTYYWPNGNGMEFFHTAEHTDVEALTARYVTVTPLWYDLSEHETLESWGARLNG